MRNLTQSQKDDMADIPYLRYLLGKASPLPWDEPFTDDDAREFRDTELITGVVNGLPGILSELEAGRKLRDELEDFMIIRSSSVPKANEDFAEFVRWRKEAIAAYDEAVTKG